MANPKTLKFYLQSEVETNMVSYVDEQGNLLTYSEVKKLVVPSKKNQKRAVSNKATGRAYIIPSEQYIKWKAEMLPEFEKFYFQALEEQVRLPIVRCNINCIFYYPDTRDRDNHNKFETIADMLVEAGVLADDSYKVFHETKMKGYCKKDKPRTEIYITIITADMKEYEWDATSPDYNKKLLQKKAIQKRIQRDKKKRAEAESLAQ